jgi:phytoene dehydrogenase-like protein
VADVTASTTVPTTASLPTEVDAVVVGAGPNGLVAANALADAGWDVLLLEANDEPGGAVRSAEVTQPGFSTDLFSAFYPLAAASRVIRDLDLESHGLRWVHAPQVLGHVLDDGRAAVLCRTVEDTAAGLDAFAPGDGERWIDLFEHWQRIRDPLLDALFTPMPPVKAALRVLTRLRAPGTLDLARLLVLPVRRLSEEHFRGDGARLLLTGNALHADIPPQAAGSGVFGWLLSMLGQDVGFPVPQGGAGSLAASMANRFTSAGGVLATRRRVTAIETSGGRAVGVRTEDGALVRARRGVLADVDAPTLYRDLVGFDRLPTGVAEEMARFHWDVATFKVNWALGGKVPWVNKDVAGAGTVHLGVDVDGFVEFSTDLTLGRAPRRPFILFGQMSTADPTRSPAGTESAWAYSHLPRGWDWTPELVDEHVARFERTVEEVAPGFRDSVLARHVQSPVDLEADDSNLVGGALNGGTAYPHQQAIFRPFTGTGRPETPLPGLFLASASAHPGGGVHGACGWNAARAALTSSGPVGSVKRSLNRTVWRRLLPG